MKNVLAQERERERQERERRRQLKEEKMDVDGEISQQQADVLEEELPSCSFTFMLSSMQCGADGRVALMW